MKVFVLFSCLLASIAAADTDGLTYATFNSPKVNLKSGQIANTPANFGPFEWVKGPIAIRHFEAHLVDANDNPVPLDEVYVHHWLLYDFVNGSLTGQNKGVCNGLQNIWGIGAELYGTKYDYPAPYAIVTTGEEVWSANLHLIRTTNVPDVQLCIECHCADAILPDHPHGGVACCPDGGQCWGMANSTLEDGKDYFLQYTIGYVPVTPDVVPIDVMSFDATSLSTYDCRIEYDLKPMKTGTTNTLTGISTSPVDIDAVYINIHQHIGGLRFIVEHLRDGKSLGTICDVEPVYGSGGSIPGNETDYLVDIPVCTFPKGYQILAGDQFNMTSIYGPRGLKGGHSWHEGVMSLMFVHGVVKLNPKQACTVELSSQCGAPPYASQDICLSCAKEAKSWGMLSECTQDMINDQCSDAKQGNNIPAPASVIGMNLNVTVNNSSMSVALRCPDDRWCGIAFQNKTSIMDGADAYVWSSNNDGGAAVERRTLGNHAPGAVTDGHYLAYVSQQDDHFNFQFTIPYAPTKGNKNCFLFAQGAEDETHFGYHGAFHGAVCGLV